jgi:hypothetical protein
MRATFVCNPASLNGKPVLDTQMHIVCYEATMTLPSKARTVLIRNEFANTPHIELGPTQLVCVPSLKKEINEPQ